MNNNNEDDLGGCASAFVTAVILLIGAIIEGIQLLFAWITDAWSGFVLWLGRAMDSVVEFLGYAFVFVLIFFALSFIGALLSLIPEWFEKRAYRKSTLGQLEHGQSVAEECIRDAQNHQKSLRNDAVEMARLARKWHEQVDTKIYEPGTRQAMLDFADRRRRRGEKLNTEAKSLDRIIKGFEVRRNSIEAHIGMYQDSAKDKDWAEIEAKSAAMLADFYDYCALHEILISNAGEEIIERLEDADGNSAFELRMQRLERSNEDLKLPPLELDDDLQGFLNQQTT